MKTLVIDWLTPCPNCGNKTAHVKTEHGSNDFLFDGDSVSCMSACGMKGVIEIFDTDSADVIWDEIGFDLGATS
jgi:NADH:ubiquinone oxidoreductase subunit E